MSKDPVCGMTVDVATAVHAERDGKKFYFCSDGCLKTFVASTASASASASAKKKTGGCCG